MTRANDAGRTASVWTRTSEVPSFAAELPPEMRVDVCVVGAGIAGLTTAYLLTRTHKRVVVVDDGPICGGETGRTTAHLSDALDDRYFQLEALHGAEGARLAAESHSAAIDWIEQICIEESIDCGFLRLDGYLFLAPGHQASLLDRELEAAHRAGLIGVERIGRAPMPHFGEGPCLRFPRQAQFHPIAYLAQLARALVRDGGQIYTHAHVEHIEGGSPGKVNVRGGHVIRADAIVVATNTPVNNRVRIHTKQMPYRTYVVGLEVPRGSVPTALFWDTGDPYHYVRLADPLGDSTTDDVLIVGGEDHKTGQEDDAEARWTRLEAWARERFPECKSVAYRWSGQVMEPHDGLAFIGRNPHDQPNVYIATGDSGHGMTHGTIAGLLLSDLIEGRENPWSKVYDPSRMSLRSIGTYARENLNSVAQYTDWLHGSTVDSVEDIPLGHGAVLRRGMKRLAVYRDYAGDCFALSAKCPHLGGVVRWNSAEQTWDCPLHGSRFDCYGRVVNGPALDDLPPADAELGEVGDEARVEAEPNLPAL
jgi:glycine/D-amino acid oxidase-like deaminating enzyme/nitrite reductase/ring-hydroxylating ferredoxin subunit